MARSRCKEVVRGRWKMRSSLCEGWLSEFVCVQSLGTSTFCTARMYVTKSVVGDGAGWGTQSFQSIVSVN